VARALLAVYSFFLALGLILSAPVWLWRMVATDRYREELRERCGQVPARVVPPPSGSAVVWVHAVSVGEVLAAGRLIAELREAGRRVYISTTTGTGQALARERFGADAVFYYPLDFAFAVRPWLRHLRPSLFCLVESEFWPRMLSECARSGVPVMVVNARISDRSWPRYQRLRRLWRPLLATLSATLAQSETDAERLRLLGARNVQMTGNLKFDVRPAAEPEITAQLRQHLPPGSKVVVCGSTLEGEEALLLRALEKASSFAAASKPAEPFTRPDSGGPAPVLIFAPRHPERFDAVAEMLTSPENRLFLRRSLWQPSPIAPGTVILLDSIGELASVYSLASFACVGGSWFPPGGGHNPLEPALLGVPVITGPLVQNFAAIVDLLRAHDAIVVADQSELDDAVRALLTNGSRAREMGTRARDVASEQAGATGRTLAVIGELLAMRKP
jgi:3-deoxy-D-manno-octulosonic-acid transferase